MPNHLINTLLGGLMRKSAMSLFGSLLLLCIFAAYAGAQTQGAQSYWHSSDYYSIQLSGAGDAFVSADINLQSLSASGANMITLSIPYRNVSVYQLISMNGSPYYGTAYPQYYGGSAQFVNYSTSTTNNSTTINIHLNKQPANASTTALYLFFSVKGIAKKTIQGYAFSFETIIDDNALIRESYASVEVPQNMYLKGEQSFNISYKAGSAQGAIAGATSASGVATLIPAIFYNPYQYQASNLLPGEYFTISGLYGSNRILLYLPEILAVALIAITIILLLIFVLIPKMKSLFSKGKKRSSHASLGRPVLVGAVSGFLFLIAYYVMQSLYSLLSYGYYYNSPLYLLFGLLSIAVDGAALFGLPFYLYINARFGKKEAIVAGITGIVAAILYLIIIAYLFAPVVMPVITPAMPA
jgi:hypothetical protein